ncbi:uncharacterized protein UV8b_00775 [Ustilaginoidea virens]|uniref:Protein required for cell viability n=1 Tax=Ustilaginoidea virens TaxID=1159556 RepID=A0A063C0A9_USTVR|nr:uncharacterized protein UV8b_00775 [Ustilaginoidea virens]QUC16534.1 hypothetical protein UV8b_00775 [Ustilaginoidea virens]GAO16660.1 hypothetical protein UVI_02012800 [Ustilaginoidea virens]
MEESSQQQNPGTKLLENIVEAAKKAFDPTTAPEVRRSELEAYNELIAKTETWILLPVLNSLIKPGILPTWLREPLLQALAVLPLRPDGVRGTMEFVFSVHPSNHGAAPVTQKPQKDGASITHEAVAVASRLLSAVPAPLSPQEWYDGIAPQLFGLFDGDAGQDLAKTAAQIVGFGILGRKQIGAPGKPGWNSFVQPLIEQINPSLTNAPKQKDSQHGDETGYEIVDLTTNKTLVPGQHLAMALGRLTTLLFSNPSPGLCKRVLNPIVVQLWALASVAHPSERIAQDFCSPAEKLVQTYLKLFGKTENVLPIIHGILCEGSVHGVNPWQYRLAANGTIDIIGLTKEEELNYGTSFAEIEPRAEKLARLIAVSFSNEEISRLFLFLLRRWIQSKQQRIEVNIESRPTDDAIGSPIGKLAEVAVLQKLMEVAPDQLVTHFNQLMDVICQVLTGDERSPLGSDAVSVVLSLLNLVITATGFHRSDIRPQDLKVIEASLQRLCCSDDEEVSGTSRNLQMLLRYRGEVESMSYSPVSVPSVRQIEDRRVYNLAMNYITGDAESPPPVVSEGLDLLSTLILAESPALDINAVTVLMSGLLKSNEDYINLRVIKVFTQLANRHPKSTTQEILDNYLDPQECSTTDTRLRFGEALLQVVERLGETFSGEVAQRTGEALLSIAGRRGMRAKTMAKQAREERLAKLKREKSLRDEDADSDEDPNDDEELAKVEKINNEILSQILQGWESKRGSEDVRMRTSALSIFGSALESNIVGVGSLLVSNAVDLCVNILTLERGLEYGILRRAAILVILGVVRAMHQAKESGRSLGFGLTESSRKDIQRTLSYVADTDNDGLVQQHARDVVESVQSWHVGTLLSQQAATSPSLSRLEGLALNPGRGGIGRPRPQIEEVE